MKNLADKTAFVTGAASGIGFGIATALAQAGAKVMLCDIEEAALKTALEGLKRTNAEVDCVKADVSLKTELQAAADATIARFGKVHVLINNAGVTSGLGYGQWNDNNWNWVLGVNLMSVVWGFEIFGPLIEAHGEGGHIVSTASIAGLATDETVAAYDVSKYGVAERQDDSGCAIAERQQKYFDWAKEVADRIRGVRNSSTLRRRVRSPARLNHPTISCGLFPFRSHT